MPKSTAEIYSEQTSVKTPEEQREQQERERQLSIASFSSKQNEEHHRIWLEDSHTKKFLLELTQEVLCLKDKFNNFGDNLKDEESLKSVGIQAIKLSVAIKQLNKVINYARTNNIAELD